MKHAFLLIFILFSALIYSIAEEEHDFEIGNIFVLPDSIKIIEDEFYPSPSDRHIFTFEITNQSEYEQNAFISLEKRYMLAESWYLIVGPDTINSAFHCTDFQISLKAKQVGRILLILNELDVNAENGFVLTILSGVELNQELQSIKSSQAFVLGILMFLFVFNIILGIVTKWNIYGLYAIYILSALLYLLYYFGLIQVYFNYPAFISVNVINILYSLIFVFYFWFILLLGNYKEASPKAAFYLKVGIWYQSIQVAVELIFYSFGIILINQIWYIALFLIFELGLMSMIIYNIGRSPDFRGRIVIAGSSFLILAAILVQFDLGLNSIYILEMGILCELLAFSAGLGFISRQYYSEKLRTEELYIQELEKNNEIQEKMQSKLEGLVAERTSHLEETTKSLEKRNKENRILLSEIHHRVKNNLQMISSMLRMQYRHLDNPDSKKALSEALNRINTIGLLHKHLYNDENEIEVNLKDYVIALWEMIKSSNSDGTWKCQIECDDQNLDMDIAFKLGIILNELILNCLKYSNAETDSKTIFVKIKNDNVHYNVEVVDFGDSSELEIEDGFGFRIIKLMIGDDKKFNIKRSQKDFTISILIPK